MSKYKPAGSIETCYQKREKKCDIQIKRRNKISIYKLVHVIHKEGCFESFDHFVNIRDMIVDIRVMISFVPAWVP